MATSNEGHTFQKPCQRCKEHEATLQIRTEQICRDCYQRYVATKGVKRLEVTSKACTARIRTTGRPPRRKYVAGLSLGPSSAALVHIADGLIEHSLARKRDPPFDLHVVHVDTTGYDGNDERSGGASSTQELLERWRAAFPRFTFERVPLSEVLQLDTVDWSALPLTNPPPPNIDEDESQQRQRLLSLFSSLPSPTSRADILRLLVRHVLVARAAAAAADALLLGSSTTALAELTLAETAKGRGFALPWLVNDGLMPVVRYPRPGAEGVGSAETSKRNALGSTGETGQGQTSQNERAEDERTTEVYVCHPVRELMRAELVTYGSLTEPPLMDLIPGQAGGALGASAVVSHRDISIEEVMARYFAGVEVAYPSVVTNVVRTTAKLERMGDHKAAGAEGKGDTGAKERCGVCAMPLDEQGDDRWRGELGELKPREPGDVRHDRRPTMCYGCERSVHG